MSFSRGQQPELRAYIAQAWAAHCHHVGADEGRGKRCLRKRCKDRDGCDFCAWYEDTLEGATGHLSTTACNAGRDYDFFMRDLEIIHAQTIKWQLRAFQGDGVRMLHEIRALSAAHGMDEDYLRAVARRMFQREDLPELHTLPREALITILGEVKRHLRRAMKRGPSSPSNEVPTVSGFRRVRRGTVCGENIPF